jgi:hypothetical protein
MKRSTGSYYDDASGHRDREAGFGCLDGPDHPTYVDLEAARAGIRQRLTRGR